MAKKPETRFKEKVIRDLKKLRNCYSIKTQERGRRGVPDIIGCLNGRFFALELKTDEGELDELQLNRLKKIRSADGFAIVTAPATWELDFSLMQRALT
jgi:hypothetical protein